MLDLNQKFEQIKVRLKALLSSLTGFKSILDSGGLKKDQSARDRLNIIQTDLDSFKTEIESLSPYLTDSQKTDLKQLTDTADSLSGTVRTLCITEISGADAWEQKKLEISQEITDLTDSINMMRDQLELLKTAKTDSAKISSAGGLRAALRQIKTSLSELLSETMSYASASSSETQALTSQLTVLNSAVDSGIAVAELILGSAIAVSEIKSQNSTKTDEKGETSQDQWKDVRLTDIFNQSQLASVNSALQTSLSFMNNIDSLLSQAQQFVDMIKLIEGALTDPLTALIQKLAKQFKSFIDQFKSTGVYVLDMIEYAYIGETRVNEALKSQLYNIDNSKYKEYIQENYLGTDSVIGSGFYEQDERRQLTGEVINSKFGTDKEELKKLNDWQYKENKGELSLSAQEQSEYDSIKTSSDPEDIKKREAYDARIKDKAAFDDARKNELLKNNPTIPFFYRWKAFTYEEWIETAAEAFMDEFDLPDGALVNGTRMNRLLDRKTKQGQSGALDRVAAPNADNFKKVFSSDTDEASLAKTSLLYGNGFKLERLKSGRPQFAKGSISKTVVFMMSAPDLTGFLTNVNILSRLFDLHSLSKEKEDFKKWQNEYDELASLFPAFTAFKNRDALNGDAWNGFIDHVNYKNRINSLITGGAAPDFYGVSMYSLMPELFNNLESILYFLNNYFNDIPPLFSDQFDSLLQLVKDKIQILRNFSQQLKKIIQYLGDLLNTSLSVLTIESTKGNQDIYDRLINAKGAAGQDTGRKLFYAGFVMCFGVPDPSKVYETLDIEGIMKETAVEFNEKTGELKEQSVSQFNAFNKTVQGFR